MTRFVYWILDRLFRREFIGLRGDGNLPYLIRWIVYRRKSGAGLYIHCFVGSDPSQDSHDHPKRFTSIGIWGCYDEEVYEPDHRWIHHSTPWFRTFEPSHRHRVEITEPCWTIVKVGPEVRTWGFFTPEGWTPWYQYRIGEHDVTRSRV